MAEFEFNYELANTKWVTLADVAERMAQAASDFKEMVARGATLEAIYYNDGEIGLRISTDDENMMAEFGGSEAED